MTLARPKKSKVSQEGGVYRCSWRRSGKHFTLRCLAPVKAEAKSESLEQANDLLLAQVMELAGDGHPCLQFVPPLPEAREARSRYNPEFFRIGYNDSVESPPLTAALFSGGVCKRCGRGLGQRTNEPRLITSVPKYDVAGFRKNPNQRFICAENVLKHILPHTGSSARCIPVVFDKPFQKRLRGKEYFEIDFTPNVQAAFPKQHSHLGGFRCPLCGSRLVWAMDRSISEERRDFVCRSEAQSPVLLLANGVERCFAVDNTLHGKMRADRTIRGLVTERVIMLDSGEIMTEEELKSCKLSSP